MRDPKRIDDFCRRLAVCWHQVPDWRFGQLMVNMFGAYGKDQFFPEDEEMIRFFEKRLIEQNNQLASGDNKIGVI